MSGNTFLLTLNQYAPGTLPYLVSHYQKRETRQQLQAQGISPLQILFKLLMQIGSALQIAHSRGITHGAIVPGNILLASYERCWLADFGIAKLSAPPVPYLPPELYSASSASAQPHSLDAYWRSVTPTSDQYMYAMLCQQLLAQVLQPGEYEQFLPILQRATQTRADRRYGNIDQLLQDLGNVLSSPSRFASADNRPQTSSSKHNTSPLQQKMATSESLARSLSEHTANSSEAAKRAMPAAPLQTPREIAAPITPILAQIDTPGGPQGGPLSADDWEKQGDKFFTQRAYDEALKAYHRAIEIVNNKAYYVASLGGHLLRTATL